MIFGFIGAGKVGCSMGKYLKEHHVEVCGYYSKSVSSAKEAAEFTDSNWYCSIQELLKACDAVFITVPDDELTTVYNEVTAAITKPMCLIHCSGLKSSDVFYNIQQYQSYGYSIHPLLAIHSKRESYKELSNSFFTIEGDENYIAYFKGLFEGIGNSVVILEKGKKSLYHASACIASNLVIGLLQKSFRYLEECGFKQEEAMKALKPLVLGNVNHIFEEGVREALTGPVERGDLATIEAHQKALPREDVMLYDILSKELVRIAKEKNQNRDYDNVMRVLERE